MLKDSRTAYGWMTIVLHWLLVPLIIFLFGLGVYMRGLDYYSPWYHRGPEIHIAIGLLVFVLMLFRLFWRWINSSPDAIPSISKANLLVAWVTKWALYGLIFVICITGYLIATAEGAAASFFGLVSIPASVQLSSENVDLAGEIHEYSAWTVIGLVILHAAGALFHHFIKRDATLKRMLKPGKSN